jgi:predicted peptidase
MQQPKKYRYSPILVILTTSMLFTIILVQIKIYTTASEVSINIPLTKTVIATSSIPTSVVSPTTTPVSNYGYTTHTFTNEKGQSLTYYLYTPVHYDLEQKYPLVLMLEGSGERDNPKRTPEQNRQVLFRAPYVQVWSDQYSGPHNPDIQQRWPCFVVVPQLVTPQSWVATNPFKGSYKQAAQPTSPLLLTKELLDTLQHEYKGIDAHRLYITGISLGGYGTWDAIERWPNYFAAAVPIAGAGDPSKSVLVTHIALWVFHGGKDTHVPVAGARDMIKAIKAAGGNPRYTEFARAGHGIWGRVYCTDTTGCVPDFYSWLFSQHKAAD